MNFEKKPFFLREKDLIGSEGILPVSRSTLWYWVRAGEFPAPVKLSKRVTAWPRQAVEQHLAKICSEAGCQSRKSVEKESSDES